MWRRRSGGMEDIVYVLAREFGMLPREIEEQETNAGIALLWKSYLAHHPDYAENVTILGDF